MCLLHSPSLCNIELQSWKQACCCGPNQSCYTCHLAGEAAKKCRDDNKDSKPKRKAKTTATLDWLLKRLPLFSKAAAKPRRRKDVDFYDPDKVSDFKKALTFAPPGMFCTICTLTTSCLQFGVRDLDYGMEDAAAYCAWYLNQLFHTLKANAKVTTRVLSGAALLWLRILLGDCQSVAIRSHRCFAFRVPTSGSGCWRPLTAVSTSAQHVSGSTREQSQT